MNIALNKNDEIVMKLLHYFITIAGYNPVILHGAKDEIWLENMDGPYKVVRINSNHIHKLQSGYVQEIQDDQRRKPY